MQLPANPSRAGVIKLGNWEVWATKGYHEPIRWSGRPEGAIVAVITGAHNLDQLEQEISAYEADIDSHVRDAREAIDALPGHWAGERAVHEALISALAALVPQHR